MVYLFVCSQFYFPFYSIFIICSCLPSSNIHLSLFIMILFNDHMVPRNGAVAGVHGAILVVAAFLFWRCQRRRQSARLQPAPRRSASASEALTDRKFSVPNDR